MTKPPFKLPAPGNRVFVIMGLALVVGITGNLADMVKPAVPAPVPVASVAPAPVVINVPVPSVPTTVPVASVVTTEPPTVPTVTTVPPVLPVTTTTTVPATTVRTTLSEAKGPCLRTTFTDGSFVNLAKTGDDAYVKC